MPAKPRGPKPGAEPGRQTSLPVFQEPPAAWGGAGDDRRGLARRTKGEAGFPDG